MGKLANKVALVTGASKGIGAGIAKALAADGASVVVNYASSKEGADKVVAEIKAKGGKAVAVQGDFSKQADIVKVFAETKSAFGRLDTLVNNAGVYAFAPLDQITEESFHKMFNLNVLGLILASQEAAEALWAGGRKHHQHRLGRLFDDSADLERVHGDQERGRWDNARAVEGAGTEEDPGELDQSRAWSRPRERHTRGLYRKRLPEATEAQTPLGRIGQPEDIGPIAVFLASDDSSWLTGELVLAGGGLR